MKLLNKELVVKLAERYRLLITIRPDGSIIGPDTRKLWELYSVASQLPKEVA